MSTKDLFKKGNKVLTKSQEAKIKSDLESTELVRDVVRTNNKFHSHVDYSKPENFAFYGSAQKYYEDSFNRVYQTYPYDGSLSEKEKWFHDSSELDLWILDNAYPKSAGHVKLGTNQSITVKGGPNNQPGITAGEKEELSKQYPVKQGNSNIWDTSVYRNSNLYIDGTLGNTIEFWAKLDASVSNTATVRLVTIRNTAGATLSVDFSRSAGSVGIVCEDDEGTGLATNFVDATFLGETWAHYSFSFINTATQVRAEFYKNGVLSKTVTSDDPIATISQEGLSLVLNGTAASTNTVNGLYLDEFRFWKRVRTAEEIGRYWLTNVHGGTNTDDNKYNTENRKVDLGIYYKFNEGVTGDASIDTTVLDYSGRISNGTITNYTSTARVTTSAFDESGLFEVAEEKDLVIYSSHPDFVSAKKLYMDTGLVYDYNNNSSIYHTMPAWIIEEDDTSGQNTKELTQIMSSYFDSAQVKIKELVNLKDVEYHTLEERTNKPYSLIRKTLESAGMVVPDLFTEASAFEEILSRGEKEKFEEKLQDVKNTIYQNIYNNLSYIYKSKGTEKSFRNLIRCFGIDDELLKINMYSDGADYLLEDSRRTTAIKKKFVDFNNADRDQGLVYTKADPSNASSDSYIRGVGLGREPNLSFTFETEVIFPKRIPSDHPGFDAPTNLEEHIAYLGEYTTSYSANDLFDLKAVKEGSDASSENVKFVLTMDGQTLETQFFKSVYENSKWNLAVRLVPKKSLSGAVSGGSTTDYRAELYCVRMLADVVEDEETVTADITEVNARALLAKDKYVSIGALHSSGNPEVESLDNDTRVKISSTLFWYDNVTNEEIRAHASDASNFGRLHPSEEAYSHDAEFATIQVPKRDTLAMHWDFSEVSTTDGSGEFIVNDLSQGNELIQTDINKKAVSLDGTDDHILISDSDAFSFTDGSTDKPFSMSAWVLVGDISTDNGPFITKINFTASTATEYLFKQANGKVQMFMYDTSKSTSGHAIRALANATSLTSDTWHHVVVTYDGSNSQNGITLYTDGSETASTKTATQTVVDGSPVVYENMRNTTIPLILGATQDGATPPVVATRVFEDKLADICVFDKELSAAEVTEIYNSNQVKDMTKFSAYDNIISWWKMGDDLDTTGAGNIKDYKGSHHGTLTNGASIVDDITLDTDSIVDGRYGWFTNLVGRQVTGLGKHFTNNDKQIVNREYVHSAKHRPPEVINSEDLIEIRSQDDLTFTKDAQITTHFFAAEKSMYQVISDDMINLFATIVEFNDLIGQPVNRYRMEYKTLEKFRARYFEKVNNVPSLEKYIELYKWIDSSIGLMIQELIPVSSNFSADLRNMVESHVLERNKYWTKFPTLEMPGEPPMGVVRGINELTYNWKEGHAPVGSETTENDKFLWGDKRVNASDITTGDSTVDDNREILRKVATRTTEGMVQVVDRGVTPTKNFVEESKPILRTPAGATYEGRTFANRALSKPYKLKLDIAKNVHGGVNYSAKTKDPNAFIRAVTRIIPTFNFGGGFTVGITPTLATNPVTYEEWKKLYTVKRTVTVTITDTELSLISTFDGDTIYPYYGYRDRDAGIDTTAVISGHHNDSYGDDAEIPMQGPFTETWVGGNQHRHVHFKEQAPADRPELYLDDSGTLKHPQEVNSNNAAARYTRDEVAKRPVNIRNIKTDTTDNSPLGNYARDYEVVQTSGRTQNNSWFVDNEGASPAEANSAFISGTTDFALPNRGRTEHVFTERFSAPGDPLTLSRGFLDTVAEEFSVYNSMNYRNLEERLEQQKRLYTHSGIYNGSQGYEDTVSGIPSIHKVNRNAFFRPVDGGCTTDYDNAYISHQIPRSDLQYAFVTASIDYDKYRTGAADERYPYDQCSDPAADKIPVLFSGYYDEIHVQKGNEGYNAPYADFQGGGWRFIRNVEKAAVMNQRRTNTYSQLVRTPRIGVEDRSVVSYIEPAVVWNKPNTHYILNEQAATLVKRGETPSLSKGRNTRPITYSYSNNLETFTNQDLADAIDLEVVSNSQFSDTLFDIFSKAELLFSHSVAREIIFPRHKNVGLKKIRTRTKFDTYKFFWKDKMFDRVKCSNTTKLGYEMTPEFKRLFKQKFSVDVMDSFHFHQDLQGSADNEHYKVIGDLTYMGEDRMRHMITRKDLDLTDSSHPLNGTSSGVSFLGLEGICEAQATSSDIVPVYSSSEITRNKTAPIPSPQLYHNPYNENYKESEGWINRKPITSGQKASYNDYDSFSEEVKLAAQNYGLVSEFRISEHMDKYILENGGNFRAKNYDFLTLDGASHDGESHTLSSGTSIKETSTFYSLKKEDDSLAITAYPTSSTDTTLVKNNAEGFFGYNPIYTPAGSDFVIANSVNSEVEILASDVENYTSIEPYQDGVSAAGKFNLDDSNHDYLDINLDNVTNSVYTTPGAATVFQNSLFWGYSVPSYPRPPAAISVWAQPEARQDGGSDTNYSNGAWMFTDAFDSDSRVCLFTSYHYSAAQASYNDLGVTLVVTDNTNSGLPGNTIDDDSTVYTFFKASGDIATLSPSKMNNIIIQIIPPEFTDRSNRNFLIKAWLNGEELYGVHIRELESSNYLGRNNGGQSINAYSPCPIGEFKGSGKPWFTDYEGVFTSTDRLRNLRSAITARLGSVNSSHKFRGLLDEFTVFTGILPSSSISAIYNNGVPNNVNELIANGQIVGNGLYEGTTNQNLIINGQVFSYPVPATVDNGEFDLGGKYYSNFESITSSGVIPTGWTTNESDETPVNGPTIQQSTLGAGNSVFALRGYLDLHSDVDDPPGAHTSHSDDHFRWIQHPQAFETGITVSFKAYQGRTSGDYGLTEEPEQSKGEYLWLQYKVGTGGTWQDAADPLQPGTGGGGTGGIWDLQTTVEGTISGVGESSSNPIYLRWIAYAETSNNTNSAHDTWGIDDIEIKESGITDDQYTAAEAQRIQILAGSTPFVKYTDFDNNYSETDQQLIEASLPVWHRIGVPSYDKVVTQGQWDDEFFSSYVHTDDINFIEAADAKHDELGLETTKKVRLKVNAIKKLLPYEGFYPQDRTVQIADLFTQKISKDIIHDEKIYKDQAIQAALQHFFAPGILYNSIKAGVACDWASYTNESGLEPSYFGYPIVHYANTGVTSLEYSKRLTPQWYTGKRDSTAYAASELVASQPTSVDSSTITSEIRDLDYSVALNDFSTLNSYTDVSNFNIDYTVKNLSITKAPNKRLPFESILDPYKYLIDGRNGTEIDADASAKILSHHNQHFLMMPSYYKDVLKYNITNTAGTYAITEDTANSKYKNFNYPYFEISKGIENKDSRYELAISNFLAESTKFFIKDESLSSFASTKPQGSGYLMESGTPYYMDVVMEKSKGFSTVNSPGTLGGRYFGPSVRWIDGTSEYFYQEEEKVSDAAFAPYVPPYFYATSRVRIEFIPTETKSFTLDEIFDAATVTDDSPSVADYFSNEALRRKRINIITREPASPNDANYNQSVAFTNRMPISSSIELFGKTKLSRQEFDVDGNPTAISSANNTELDTWIIYTKFECPLFDFSESSNSSDEGTLDALGINKNTKETLSKITESGTYDYTSSYLNTQNTERFTVDKRTGSGIWAGLGRQNDGAGVTISIRESYPRDTLVTADWDNDGSTPATAKKVGSLIDVCGFTPETKQIGRVADEREITEAIVMIPFLDEPVTTEQKLFGGGSRQVYATTEVDDRNFIKIDKLEYRRQKRKLDKDDVIYTNEEGIEIRETSITSMIEGMRNYNVPPLYDFETFDQDPFVMYFFEFKHTLDREDLSNIWQGVQPKIAKEAKLDSVEIDHEINPYEFFGNIGELPEGVRWMTFKVKRKAEKSYYKMTQDSRDDSRFKFDFEVGTKEPEYGYNYPYDYFTMLEKVQVEVNSEKEVEPLEQDRIVNGEED